MRIALFNVKYSPNLGDGLLSECLERELRRALPGAEVASIDLAGRTRYGGVGGRRRMALRLLEYLPSALRQACARLTLRWLVDSKLRPRWRTMLEGVDAVVVGGGNLFADADLNFPTKVAGALIEARALPAAVFAVGVTPNWSREGKRLFGDALARARLASVTVRDTRSQEAWARMLAGRDVPPAQLARDPGLLASRHYPARAHPSGGRNVAFGLIDPLAVRYHVGHAVDTGGLERWFGEAIAALTRAGFRVTLFTNGSPEDHAFMEQHQERWAAEGGGAVEIAPAFADPAALATFLSGADLVIAHRMHACIAAYSFAVATIGLAWDAKLASFLEITGRSGFLVDPAGCTPAELGALAARAVEEGVDPAVHGRLLDEASADVAALGAALQRAVVAA